VRPGRVDSAPVGTPQRVQLGLAARFTANDPASGSYPCRRRSRSSMEMSDARERLNARVRAARDSAHEIAGDSRALIGAATALRRYALASRTASENLRARDLVTRCAWCGRHNLGGDWTEPEATPRFVANLHSSELSHTICPDCVDELRRDGKSR
jgi:hypothetical protein